MQDFLLVAKFWPMSIDRSIVSQFNLKPLYTEHGLSLSLSLSLSQVSISKNNSCFPSQSRLLKFPGEKTPLKTLLEKEKSCYQADMHIVLFVLFSRSTLRKANFMFCNHITFFPQIFKESMLNQNDKICALPN